jgi:hypothetical protein
MKPVNTIGIKINNQNDTNTKMYNDTDINNNDNNNDNNDKSNIQINISNEFEKIESINKLNSSQIRPQYDFYKDFEMKENIEKKLVQNNSTQDIDELNMMLNLFPIINDNIRSNIQLSVDIYKKINNFDINYVHNCINEKMKK